MEILNPFINNAGAVILIIILYKSGVLNLLLNKNGNGKEKRVEELEEHAKVANAEMKEVKEQLIALNTKVDIIMRHLNL